VSLDKFFPIGDDDWSAFDAAARNQKKLKDATDAEIKQFALSFRQGYALSDEDCQEIRKPVASFHDPDNETVAEAVDDFIKAYGG
jgi:hypothetical protein